MHAHADQEPAPTLLTIRCVRYQDTNGEAAVQRSVLLQPGRTTIHANNGAPTDYVLTGASSVTVSVASNSRATGHGGVYLPRASQHPAAQSINIPVYYQAQNGTCWAAYVSCFYGRATVIYAQNNNVPSGYTGQPDSVTINVSQGGVPTPSSAAFTYRAWHRSRLIPITYKDTNGETLHTIGQLKRWHQHHQRQ